MTMAREKVGELLGIDIIVDDDLPADTVVMHNAKEAYTFRDGKVEKVPIQNDWARESRLAGKGLMDQFDKPTPKPKVK
jgi:hypothetical protein